MRANWFETPRPGDPAPPNAVQRNAWGYHLGNLLVHLAGALTLFGIVRRTLLTAPLRERFGGPASYVAFSVALLWVVHPLHTGAVTYIVQRVESLMGLFYLLTLYCAIRAAEGRHQAAWTAGALVSCALGMGSKEIMVTAPLVVALWDVTFRPDERPRWTLLTGLAATWTVFAWLVYHEHRAPSIAFDPATSWRYLLTQAGIVSHYLRLSIVPSPLLFLYDWPLASSLREVAPQALLLVAAVALTVAGLFKRHPLAFTGACFFLILAPTSSVLPIITEVAAEHRMYLPLAAVLACLVAGGFAALARQLVRTDRKPTPRTAIAVAAVAVLTVAMLYVTTTRRRNLDYSSELALWGDTVAKAPASTRARVAYGTALVVSRRLPEAEEQFRAAIALDGHNALAHTRLASILASRQQFDAAIDHLRRAIAIHPENLDAQRFLGQIHLARREDARALPHLNHAVRLTGRQDAAMLEMLSAAQAGTGRLADAASTAREALALARANGNGPLVARLEQRLRSYGR